MIFSVAVAVAVTVFNCVAVNVAVSVCSITEVYQPNQIRLRDPSKLGKTHLVDNLGRSPDLGRWHELSLRIRLDLNLGSGSSKSLLLDIRNRLELQT